MEHKIYTAKAGVLTIPVSCEAPLNSAAKFHGKIEEESFGHG